MQLDLWLLKKLLVEEYGLSAVNPSFGHAQAILCVNPGWMVSVLSFYEIPNDNARLSHIQCAFSVQLQTVTTDSLASDIASNIVKHALDGCK